MMRNRRLPPLPVLHPLRPMGTSSQMEPLPRQLQRPIQKYSGQSSRRIRQRDQLQLRLPRLPLQQLQHRRLHSRKNQKMPRLSRKSLPPHRARLLLPPVHAHHALRPRYLQHRPVHPALSGDTHHPLLPIGYLLVLLELHLLLLPLRREVLPVWVRRLPPRLQWTRNARQLARESLAH